MTLIEKEFTNLVLIFFRCLQKNAIVSGNRLALSEQYEYYLNFTKKIH